MTKQILRKSLLFLTLCIFVSFALLYFAIETIAHYTIIALPLKHILTFPSNKDVPLTFSSNERCTGSARGEWTAGDSARQEIRGRRGSGNYHRIVTIPTRETNSFASTIGIQHPKPSQKDFPSIESDSVPPTFRQEYIEKTITSSNPSARDHFHPQRALHEAATTEHISDGATEELAPHLEASILKNWIFYFFNWFENFLLKIELSEITIFLQQFFFGWGGIPTSPWLRLWCHYLSRRRHRLSFTQLLFAVKASPSS